jgi:hypothetical protein
VIQSKLNGVDGRSSSQVVHSRLETLLPSVEVHRGQLTHRRVGQVDVERLGLVDEGTSVGGEVDDGLLADLPDGLVDRLQLGRDAGNVLNGTAMGDAAERGRTRRESATQTREEQITLRHRNSHPVLHVIVPQPHVDEIPQQPGTNDLELSSQDPSGVNVARVRLETLVPSQDLRRRRGRHGRDQERVSETVLGDIRLERGPVPEVARGDSPEVVLQPTLGSGRTGVRRVVTVLLGHLAGRLERGVVDGLEDLQVELTSGRTVESHSQGHERVGETLNTETDGSVTHVRVLGLDDGVIVDVDDPVQVLGDDLGDGVQLLEVVLSIVDERGQGERGQVADGDLVGGRVLDDFGTQVGRLDRSQVLLVRFGCRRRSADQSRCSPLFDVLPA